MPQWAVALLLLLLGAAAWPANGKDAWVSQDPASYPDRPTMTLREAFQDQSVTTITVVTDILLNQDEWLPKDEDFMMINRNLLVTGAGDHIIDFNYTQEAVMLAPKVAVTFKDIALNNTRRGSGLSVDLFAPLENSTLAMVNTWRVRLVCTPSYQAVLNSKAYPRPGGSKGPQVMEILPSVTYRGHVFSDVLHLIDFQRDVVPDPEAQRHDEDFVLKQINVSRLCYEYVTAECVREYGDDMCIQMRLDQILAEAAAAPSKQATPAYAIAVPVVLGAALLATMLGGLLYCRRRRAATKKAKAAASAAMNNGDYNPLDGDQWNGGELKRSGPLEEMVLGGHHRSCWQLVAFSKASGMASDFLRDRISLGVLLGAGSFGRVYKGRWQDMDVAIKVLQHDSSTAAAVANEVDLMMSFKHPNVVKAYHFVTWSLNMEETSPAGSAGLGSRLGQQAGQAKTSPLLANGQIASGTTGGGPSGPSNSTAISKRTNSSNSSAAAAANGFGGTFSSSPRSVRRLEAVVVDSRNGSITAAAVADPGVALAPLPPAPLQQQQQQVVPLVAVQEERMANGREQQQQGQDPQQWQQLHTSIVPMVPLGRLWHQHHQHQHHQHQLQQQQAAATAAAAAAGTTGSPSSSSCQLVAGHIAHDISELSQAGYQELPAAAAGSTGAGATGSQAPSSGSKARERAGKAAAEAQTWLILEFCDMGTLLDMVVDGQLHESSSGKPCMGKLLTRLRDVAAGMQYLHARNVLHGDLKSLNILIASHGSAPYGSVAKVSDFGLSRSLKCGQTHRSTRTFGTVNHMSPEQLRLGKMSPAGDVYAFGIMMWEVYTGQQAFQGCHYGEVFEKVALHMERPPIPEDMLPEYRLLMTSCWNVDPVQRPGFDSVLRCLQMMLDHCEEAGAGEEGGQPGVALKESPFIGDL